MATKEQETVESENGSAKEVKSLNDQQRLFVEHYLVTWNATESAKRAGYSERTAYSQGQRLLKNVEIARAVSARVSEVAMSADEVLIRLARHARGSLKPFVRFGDDGIVTLDFESDEAQDNFDLLKKFKPKTRVGGPEDDRWTEQEIELELHDPQSALVHLGRYHRLFTDRTETTHSGEVKVRYVNDWRNPDAA